MRILLILCALLALATPAFAYDWVQNPVNGHWYKVVASGPISWNSAANTALNMNGYLVSIQNADENLFVFNLVKDDPSLWYSTNGGYILGPWLGGFQLPNSLEPEGGWCWHSGENFVYTNWRPAEPTNIGEPNDSGGLEDKLQFTGIRNSIEWYWNDLSPDGLIGGLPTSYIVEAVPEPSSLLALGGGLIGLARFRKKN